MYRILIADPLAEAGLECPVVSGGGSPDMWKAGEVAGVTEHRIGTYIYNDRSLVERGTCGWEDCALTVHVTVVSTPAACSPPITPDTATSISTGPTPRTGSTRRAPSLSRASRAKTWTASSPASSA